MGTRSTYSAELRERAVRMVLEHESEHSSRWAAVKSIAGKIGCSPEALRKWVQQAERDRGVRAGLSTSDRDRLKQLERENFELRRANEILRKASAFFAQAELDRRANGGVHRRPPRRIRGRADLRSIPTDAPITSVKFWQRAVGTTAWQLWQTSPLPDSCLPWGVPDTEFRCQAVGPGGNSAYEYTSNVDCPPPDPPPPDCEPYCP
jgi:transposase